MKEKLQSALGSFGGILYWILIILIGVLPLVMIGTPFWLDFIILAVCAFIPYLSLPLWIWGLVEAIKGPQDIFAIIYYIATVVIFLPTIISIFSGLFNAIKNRFGNHKAKKESTHTYSISALDLNTDSSTNSTKSSKPKFKAATIVLSITTAIFMLSTVILSGSLFSISSEYNELNTKINSLEISIKQKDSRISQMNTQIANQKHSISDLEDNLYFYETYAACVNDGDAYYHKPDCMFFDDSYFYMYNTDAAEARGYDPCPYCH